MSAHKAIVSWKLSGDFLARRYDRGHIIRLEGGREIPGTPSPAVVPAPFSHADAMDPEAAFTAALSACHMLWFLDLASRAGIVVETYEDEAEGTLGRVATGKMAMTRVALRPKITFQGPPPSQRTLQQLHHDAHERCFIANSVTTEVVVEPR